MNPVERPLRYVAYARKSTDREDKQMLSIPAQLDELRELAERHGVAIAEERIEHCSAREPGRPVFSKLLAEIARGEVDGLLCWKLDRLARNPIDGGAITHYLGKGLLKEIVTHEGVHTGTSDTKFMLQVHFGAATKTVDDLSTNVKRGNRKVHAQGRITGRPGLGYIKRRDGASEFGAAPVRPDPERFELVRSLWADVLSGSCTLTQAWRRAVERGLRTRASRKKAAAPVSLQTVRNTLRNPFYAGIVVRAGESYPGAHEPMVTREEFARVQRLLARTGTPRPSRNEFLYAGLLHCGHCNGSALVGEHARGRSRYYSYYRCHRRDPVTRLLSCRAPAPREEQVTADIAAYLDRVTLPPATLAWSREFVGWWHEQRRGTVEDDAERAAARVHVIERRLRELTNLLLDGVIDRAEHLEQKTTLSAELVDQRRLATSPLAALDEWHSAVGNLLDMGAVLGRRFREGSDEEKRLLLGQICLNQVVEARNTVPVLRFPYSILEDQPAALGGTETAGLNRPPNPETVLECKSTAPSPDRDERGWCTWSG